MKKLLLPMMLSVSILLTGCAGGTSYLNAAATIASTYDVARHRHKELVEEIIKHVEVFSEEEKALLKVQLARLKAVRANIENLKNSHDKGEKILLGSGILDDYAELKDAYMIAMDIVMSKIDLYGVDLKYALLAQQRDIKKIDGAVQVLLSKPDGNDYGSSLNSILKLIRSAAQIAIAVG